MENYFNKNYLPSNMNIEESEISQSYFEQINKMNYHSQGIGFKHSHPNYQKFNINSKNSYVQPNYQKSNSELNKISNVNPKLVKNFHTPVHHINHEALSAKSTSPIFLCHPAEETSMKNLSLNPHPPRNFSSTDDNNKEKRSSIVERQGDWVCVRCKNLNFSFRVVCNRCKLSKNDSQTFYEDHMKNLMNIVQYNEMLQKKVTQNSPNYPNPITNFVNTNNINNRTNVFNSSLFSINTPSYNNNKNKCKTAEFITNDFLNK